MEMFAEAGDGEEALAALKARHHPHIVLMDVSLKTVSGFDVTEEHAQLAFYDAPSIEAFTSLEGTGNCISIMPYWWAHKVAIW